MGWMELKDTEIHRENHLLDFNLSSSTTWLQQPYALALNAVPV